MLGALLGAGASLLGNFINSSKQEDINERNRQAQAEVNAQNLAFSREQMAQQAKYADLNLAQQKEFAQQGIRWKTDDAIAAGLHPLAALGAQVSSYSPVSVGSSSLSLEAPEAKHSPVDLSDFGQNISRAIDAGSTAQERQEKLMGAVGALSTTMQLEKQSLENDLIRTHIAKQRGQLGPPIPIPKPGPERTVSLGTAVQDDDIKQKSEDYPATKIVRPFGYPLVANPFFNDGQQFEDRYGDSEIGSTIKFAVNTLADHIITGYGLFKGNSPLPLPKPWGENQRPASETRWRRRN